jgi:hypothetical protein
MRLLKLPEAPEPVVEEGYKMCGGLFGLLTGTAEFVKFRRETSFPPMQRRPKTIIVNFDRKDRKLVERLESDLEVICGEMYAGDRFVPKMDLVLDGFIFFGVFPLERMAIEGDWLLSVDHYEEVMSHKQHYRYKHFPTGVKRQEFTTTQDFIDAIMWPGIEHVVVDSQTAQLLSDDFESYQRKAIVPPAQYRQVGLLLELHVGSKSGDRPVLIFSDMGLARNTQWVNENPGSFSARPQFIVVEPDQLQPFSYTK